MSQIITDLPKIHDFNLVAGDDKTLIFTWKDSDGALVDVTGYAAELAAKTAPDAGSDSMNLASGTEITLGGAAGTITVAIPNAKSAALSAGKYFYDLQLTDPDTKKTTLVKGLIHVEAGIS